jgi:hypothetical protein
MTTHGSMPTLTREITLGDLIKMVLVAIGLVTYFVNGNSDAKHAKDEFSAFRVEVDQHFTQINASLDEVKKSVSPLNVLNSQVETLRDDMKGAKTDISRDERDISSMRSDLDGILRPSQMPLPGERRR